MKAAIILAHGSKRVETEQTLNSLVTKVRQLMHSEKVVPAYLQFSEQDLSVAAHALASEGADEIAVMPMFIFDGIHVTEDIPAELEKIRQAHPGVRLYLTKHIGDDDLLARIIADRLNG